MGIDVSAHIQERLAGVHKRITDIQQRMQGAAPALNSIRKGPQHNARSAADAEAGASNPVTGVRTNQIHQTNPSQSLETSGSLNRLNHRGEPLAAASGFGAQLDALIQQTAQTEGVNPDLIRAMVKVESNGKQAARSKAGAIGLMQLMPETARELGVNPTSARENLTGGVRYIKEMAGRHPNLDLALAAYNAGPGRVQRYGGVPPIKETQDYVQKIRAELERLERK